MHFDARAEVYEHHRPPYPDALWARLRDLGLLGPLRVLELGAGTGEATAQLVAGGAAVTAVEPGPALVERLRRNVPDAEVVLATAEDAALPSSAFDLAVVATAVHWLDLPVVLPKMHRALRPAGRLAVWRTVYGDPAVSTPFRQQVAEIVARRARPVRTHRDDPARWARDLTVTGHFVERHREVFRWTIELDPDQVRGLFSTFSDWTPDEVAAAAQAVEGLGGRVTEHYLTPLAVLERVDA